MPKDVKFNIKLTIDGKEQLVTATSSVKELGAVIDATKTKTARLRGALMDYSNLGNSFFHAIDGFRQLSGVFQEFTDAHSVQIQAETKLAQVMKNTMNASDSLIRSIISQTSAQQKLGVIGDEVQIAGAAELAVHLKHAESLRALIPLMNDLIAKQDGVNATESSAVNVAKLLGKAMDGQVGEKKGTVL